MYTGPNIVKSGLVLWLDAANPSSYPRSGTSWTDLSGNANTGTLVNGPTFSALDLGSISFDGVDDYAQVANNASLNSNIGTVSVWFKYSVISGAVGSACLIGKHDSTSSFNGFIIYVGTGGNIGVQIKNNTQTTNATQVPGYPSNTWRNVTLTYSSGVSHTLYANNVLYSSGTCVSFTMTSQPLRMIDSIDSFWGIMSGNISNVQMYNRVLSPTEIDQNFQATRARYGV